MDKIRLGQKVYLQNLDRRPYNRFDSIEEYIVSRVGRKYFEVMQEGKDYFTVKFCIDDLTEVGEYNPNWKLYLSIEEYKNSKESRELKDKIKKYFEDYNNGITLKQLREIVNILDVK